MMHVGTVQGWLDRITYKPDTRLEAHGYDGHVIIRITRMLPDSTRGLKTLVEYADDKHWIRVGAVLMLNMARFDHLSEDEAFEYFVEWLRNELLQMERHELDEWLRVDDRLPFDPHAVADKGMLAR